MQKYEKYFKSRNDNKKPQGTLIKSFQILRPPVHEENVTKTNSS